MALRDKKLDATKMFLIVLVFFGHIPLLEGLIPIRQPHDYDALTWLTVHGIYAFHMPLFVFLSGLFSRKKSFKEQWNSSKKLLRLFIVFQIVDLALSHIFAPHTFSLREFVSPCFALWYLLCLFYWRMLLSAIPSSCKPEWVMCVSVAACLAIGFVPVGNEFGLHRFFSLCHTLCLDIIMDKRCCKLLIIRLLIYPPIRKDMETIIMFGIYGSNDHRVIQSALA